MKKVSVLVLLFLSTQILVAQPWMNDLKKKNGEYNFYDIQTSFDHYFENKEKGKGTGWKQFKRIEYMMEPRVYPSGKIPEPGLGYHEFMKYKEKNKEYFSQKSPQAANWQNLGITNWVNGPDGTNPGNGRINIVVPDPVDPNLFYIGTPGGGMWKTPDEGATWIPMTDNLPSLGVSGIAIDPNNTQIIYIATGDGDRHGGLGEGPYSFGILKSTDGGTTWQTTGLSLDIQLGEVFSKLVMSPDNSDVLIAASTDGLFRTTDGGNNWVQSESGNDVKDIEFKPGDPSIVYASTRDGGNNAKFYKSTDNGASWTQITSGLPTSDIERIAIAVSPADPDYVYIASSDGGSGLKGIYRSTNSGTSFSLTYNDANIYSYEPDGSVGPDGNGHAWYDQCIAVSPTDINEVYVGAVNIWKSTNGGFDFNISGYWWYPNTNISYIHADVHDLVYKNGKVYAGCDGGFSVTSDGVTWEDRSNGLINSQFYRIAGSASDANLIMCGAQDNGSYKLDGSQWTHAYLDDGMEQLVHPTNPNIVYSTVYFGRLYKSTDRGTNYSSLGNPGGNWVTPMLLDPNDPDVIYIGGDDLYKSSNAGNSFNSISNLSGGNITAIDVAPSNSDYIYVAKQSRIYMTSNGGNSWTEVTAGLPNLSITYIATSSSNPNQVWITLSGYSDEQKVYTSTDGGQNWINYSENLPNIPANTIVYEAGSSDGLYMGMDVGIYYRNNTMNAWMPYIDNMPNVIVTELEIHYGTSKIRAATFGRGLWEGDLFTSSPSSPIAAFSADEKVICPGTTISYTDQSFLNPDSWQWTFENGNPATSTLQHPTVQYPSPGTYDVTLNVTNSNGSNELIKSSYITVISAQTPPLTEGFENPSFPPSDWIINNPDGSYTWERRTDAGNNSSSCMVMNNADNSNIGEIDDIKLQSLDFSNSISAVLTFDVAYTKYDNTSPDELRVYVSTDCGQTWTQEYFKTHTDLETVDIATNQSNNWVPSQASDWRMETVDLNSYVGNANVIVKFENTSGYGTRIWVDNINIDHTTSITELNNSNFIQVFPNPSNGIVNIRNNLTTSTQLIILDSRGRKVLEESIGSSEKQIDLSECAKGVYYARFKSENHITIKQLIIY